MMVYFKTCAAALLAFVLTIPTPTFQQPTQFETVYDAQKDLTTTRLPFSRLSGEKERYHSVDFSVFFTYKGKTKPVPESVNFELISVVKAWKLNSDLYVVFVVDGEQLHFGSDRSAIPNPVKGRTWVGERMIFNIPFEKFERLASAKELAIKMGPTLFLLSDEAHDSLRAFAKECRR
jgi:hypothetical protein